MTVERWKELLPVIQAFTEGKTVEQKHGPESDWKETKLEYINTEIDYRIKPEPRRFWIAEYKSGVLSACYHSEEDARINHPLADKFLSLIEDLK